MRKSYNSEIINRKCALFLGAGASAPLGLKTTGAFLEILPVSFYNYMKNKGSDYGDIKTVQAFLIPFFNCAAKHNQVEIADSEVILDYVNELFDYMGEMASLPPEIQRLGGGNGNFTTKWRKWLDEFRLFLQTEIVKHYSRIEDTTVAINLYKPLINMFGPKGQTMPVFATNYDWVFEHLSNELEANIHLFDGFVQDSFGTRWSSKSFDEFKPIRDKSNIVLFKLHGSTSWYWESEEEKTIRKFPNPMPDLAGSRAVLIYPTQVKTLAVAKDPFQTCYKYFLQTLLHANLCIAIGSSFRDPAINERIKDSFEANNNLRMIIIDPIFSTKKEHSRFFQRINISAQRFSRRIRFIPHKFGSPEATEKVEKIVTEWRLPTNTPQ